MPGLGPVGVIEGPFDHHRLLGGHGPAVPGAAPGDECLHCGNRPADSRRAAPDLVRRRIEHDPAVIDYHHPLQQVGDLVDQVGGQHHRPGVIGEVGEQPVVEQLPGDCVQAGVGFVEKGHLGPSREADDDAQRRAHPSRELLYDPVGGQRELIDQRLGQLGAPVGIEPGAHP